MAKQYDAVIIGGGHNGLVAAFYLAQAGFDVCVLERFHTVGGAAFSEEIEGAPGHIASTGSYVLSLAPQKILSDLDVWEHGLELVPRNPRSFTPFPDGSYLVGWEDRERYKQDVARLSKKDANALDHFGDFIARGAEIMDKYILRQPPSWSEFAAEFNRPGDQHVFQKLFLGSVADLAEYFFEHPYMQGAIAGGGLIGTFRGPRDAGTAYNKLYLSMGMATGTRGAWSYVRGAMGSVSRAFADAARLNGVEVRTNVEVERVLVRNGRAVGVATSSGEEVSAKVVLSNADPKRTYLSLVELGELPEQYRRDIEAIQIESPVMKVNLAIAELPRFTALDGPEADYTWGYNGGLLISPSIDYLERAYQDARGGHPSDEPLMNIHCQSAVDRSVAPEGKHTMSIFAQFFPYDLAEGTWEERREEIARHVIRRLADYAPNVEESVIAIQALGPPDIEARFGLTGGHIYQGELVPEQAFDMRPVPGSTSYQGPIHGLYLCGSGAWPGGCVMGAPGHNAAHEAIARLSQGEYN